MDNEKKGGTTSHHERAPEGGRRFGEHDDSSGDTATANETLGHGNVPDVDTKYASEIQVSKLKGKWLMWMVSEVLFRAYGIA